MCICVYVNMCICVYVYMCICVYVCMCVCGYPYVRICVYAYLVSDLVSAYACKHRGTGDQTAVHHPRKRMSVVIFESSSRRVGFNNWDLTADSASSSNIVSMSVSR
jgi:hypothetical protein